MTAAPDPTPEPRLVRTENGIGLHLPDCYHVVNRLVRDATAQERATIRLCDWSKAELGGCGRTPFETLEDAMRFFGTHAEDLQSVRDQLRAMLFDQLWVPYSKAYIAVARRQRVVAWVHMGYIDFPDGRVETLPSLTGAGGGGARRPALRYGDPCPRCYQAVPLTGSCDNCE